MSFLGHKLRRSLASNTSEGNSISSITYDSESFTGAQWSNLSGSRSLALSSAGDKLFIVADDSLEPNPEVFQYTLSTAGLISSATYDSISYDLTQDNSGVEGITFNSIGTKMYQIGFDDNIYQYTLSTPYSLSTASYDSVSLDLSPQDGAPRELFFSSEGSKLFVIGDVNNRVYQYNLSTAFDLSSATYNSQSPDLTGEETSPVSVGLNSDGTKLYVVGFGSQALLEYNLTTPFEISTAVFGSSFSLSAQGTNYKSFRFSDDGSKLYLLITDTVYQYSVAYE